MFFVFLLHVDCRAIAYAWVVCNSRATSLDDQLKGSLLFGGSPGPGKLLNVRVCLLLCLGIRLDSPSGANVKDPTQARKGKLKEKKNSSVLEVCGYLSASNIFCYLSALEWQRFALE